MILAALALAAVAGGSVAPRPCPDATARESVFPVAWRLPDALWLPPKEPERTALARSMPELLAARFVGAQPWMASFGDVVAEHRRRGGERAALDAVLAELRSGAPEAHARMGALLAELLDDRALREARWNPDTDRPDDGMWFGPLLERRASSVAPWKSQGGSRRFHQAVALVHADLDAVVGAIHDYATSISDPGTSYERLEPVADSLLVGDEPGLGPFAALRVRVRSDLPFPFTHYDCDLRVLHSLEGRTLVTDIHSASSDFHWFAGKDWYLPVRTAAGEWVGTLVVRLSGFDLSGVPDGDDDRKSGTRTALGSVKRRAEASFAAAGGTPRTIDGAVPAFVATIPAKPR